MGATITEKPDPSIFIACIPAISTPVAAALAL